jgi:hypothetical protein
MPGFSLFEGLVEREDDYALIISLDSVNSSAFVEAYTPIPSPDSSTIPHIYLSTCDLPDTKSLTFSHTNYTHADSLPLSSDCLVPYTDLFLSTKKNYKPVTKRICPVIGELPKKFHIERKIIAIHSTTYQSSTPTLRHSHLPTATPSSDETNLTRIILATSCGQQRET